MAPIIKDQLCAQIISLENEIEMMKENNLKGIQSKRKELKQLHNKLKKITALEKPHEPMW